MKQKTKSILLIATLCLSLACISRIYGETQYDVFIYVDLSITGIQDSLNQYRDDLENEGWSCFQRNVTSEDMSKDASFFRSDLAYFHSLFNIKGAIFVGDFPSANWKNGYLTDYYYMDLDGNWYDTNNDTAYDVHNGTIGPEIWVGRLMASTIVHWHWEYPLNETELVNDYFAKNHQYRNASSRAESTRPRALAYIDNQFAYGGDIRNESGYGYNPVFVNDTVSCFEKAYADVALVADPIANGTNTNANAYMNSLKNTDGYEWTWVFDHGRTEEHGFAKYFWNETSEVWQAPLMPNEGSVGDHYYQTDTPKTFFYIFSSCSAAKFSEDNCVANVAIFGEGNALASIGMTEDGSFPASWFFEAFDQLGQHRCIGEAFKALYNSTINYYDGAKAYKRLILLGDPTIKTNSPPYAPSQLSGQESGYLEVPYDYSANTTDLNGDQISYQFNWDDGTNTITEWHNSGETGNASHAWSCPGTYSVKVRAKDNYTTWSDWSQPFNVAIDERIRYMQSVKWPNSTYWKLFWNNTSTSASQVKCKSGYYNKAYLGVKIYKGGTCISGDDVIEVGYWYNLQSSLKDITWNCSEQNVTGTYIKIEIWYKFSGCSWQNMSVVFKTETFSENTMLNATTWTIGLYGEYQMDWGPLRGRAPPGQNKGVIRFYWGSEDEKSRIEDMAFTHG